MLAGAQATTVLEEVRDYWRSERGMQQLERMVRAHITFDGGVFPAEIDDVKIERYGGVNDIRVIVLLRPTEVFIRAWYENVEEAKQIAKEIIDGKPARPFERISGSIGFKGMVSTWYLESGRICMKVGRVRIHKRAVSHVWFELSTPRQRPQEEPAEKKENTPGKKKGK